MRKHLRDPENQAGWAALRALFRVHRSGRRAQWRGWAPSGSPGIKRHGRRERDRSDGAWL